MENDEVDQDQLQLQEDSNDKANRSYQNYLGYCLLESNIEEEERIQRDQIIYRQRKISPFQIFGLDESVVSYQEQIEEIIEQSEDEQINDNQKEENQKSLEEDAQKSTDKVRRCKTKNSNQQVYQNLQVGTDNNSQVQVQEKQKHQSYSQRETKNLPNYYGRQFVNKIKRKLKQEQNEQMKSEMNQKLEKLKKKQKMFTLRTLRDIIDEEYFREESKKYLTSFEFLHDLMQSDKQQDIRPPIKYAKRMYEGCLDKQKLFCWKED